ncbi:MAG: prepilin-type N-terminal cleavage/methylation domain-containing protein [Candidatus Shapirobacteria bacterium]|nr:prepilin-type N-terminal cleavage/methylation domain-containing protein [Candidatus Shapirobacteria bacterium]
MKKIFNFANRGQSIIEVVIALAIVAIVIVGLVKVTTISMNNGSFARDQQTATKYAQEGLENARKLKEEDINVFWKKSGVETEIIGKFVRQITYTIIEANQTMKVEVLVTWQDSKGTHQSSLETSLTKWK